MKKLLADMRRRTKWKSFLGIRKAKRIPKYDHVDLYFDRMGNVVLIPLAYAEKEFLVELDRPIILKSPVNASQLGSSVREAVAHAMANPFMAKKDSIDVWSKATGIKDREVFVRDRYGISFVLNDKEQYIFSFCYHDELEGKMAFCSTFMDPELEIQISSTVSDEELGEALLCNLHKGIARFEPGFFDNKSGGSEGSPHDGIKDGPLPFGYKISWLALKSSSSDDVLKALGCSSVSSVSWRMGLDEADIMGETTFVSEPIGEYVLAIGVGDLSLEELSKLAENFEDVQYYLTERVIDYQAWAHFHEASLVRAYKFIGESGEVLWDEGEQDQAEKDLGLTGLPTTNGDWPDKTTFPTENHVIDLAAHFSIDPLFRDASYPKQSGYLCSR